MDAWQPWETAPRDGSWLIALCNDKLSLMRVSWGRDRDGELRWCCAHRSYGDGLFKAWLPFPEEIITDVDATERK